MRITVFAKDRKTKDGRDFKSYLTKLMKKDGEEVTVEVRFKKEAGYPKKTPCILNCEKKDLSYTEKSEEYTGEDGELNVVDRKRLWVSNFIEEEYIDTSMDDFE